MYFISGDSRCVPRGCSVAVRGSLVDHTGGGSCRDLDFGFVGVSALEGEYNFFLNGCRFSKEKRESVCICALIN